MKKISLQEQIKRLWKEQELLEARIETLEQNRPPKLIKEKLFHFIIVSCNNPEYKGMDKYYGGILIKNKTHTIHWVSHKEEAVKFPTRVRTHDEIRMQPELNHWMEKGHEKPKVIRLEDYNDC